MVRQIKTYLGEILGQVLTPESLLALCAEAEHLLPSSLKQVVACLELRLQLHVLVSKKIYLFLQLLVLLSQLFQLGHISSNGFDFNILLLRRQSHMSIVVQPILFVKHKRLGLHRLLHLLARLFNRLLFILSSRFGVSPSAFVLEVLPDHIVARMALWNVVLKAQHFPRYRLPLLRLQVGPMLVKLQLIEQLTRHGPLVGLALSRWVIGGL